MRRTVIFVTLISLLIAVAGVTAAQNGGVDLDGETTTPEPAPEATVEAPEPTTRETPQRLEETSVEQPGHSDGGKHRAETPGPEDAGNRAGPEGERGNDNKAEPDGRGEEPHGEKAIVCHWGKTLSVGAPAKPAHLGHGDSSGPC